MIEKIKEAQLIISKCLSDKACGIEDYISALEAIDECLAEYLPDEHSPTAGETFTFEFEATNNKRHGIPYVARLTGIDSEGKFEREFFDLERSYGKETVPVAGTYTVKNGDLLEIRIGGSWKNDYRGYYLIHGGEEVYLGDTSNSRVTASVKRFLRGEITAITFDAIDRADTEKDKQND